jgi:hypothetical protein
MFCAFAAIVRNPNGDPCPGCKTIRSRSGTINGHFPRRMATAPFVLIPARGSRLPPDLIGEERENRLLSVQPVLRLTEDCLRMLFENLLGDFFSAIGWQAMHDQGSRRQ